MCFGWHFGHFLNSLSSGCSGGRVVFAHNLDEKGSPHNVFHCAGGKFKHTLAMCLTSEVILSTTQVSNDSWVFMRIETPSILSLISSMPCSVFVILFKSSPLSLRCLSRSETIEARRAFTSKLVALVSAWSSLHHVKASLTAILLFSTCLQSHPRGSQQYTTILHLSPNVQSAGS